MKSLCRSEIQFDEVAAGEDYCGLLIHSKKNPASAGF